MRRKLLGASVVGLSIFTLGYFAITTSPEKQYSPRENVTIEMAAEGAMQYAHRIRANQNTGKISVADVQAARQQLDLMATLNKTSAVGLNWESKGPDNVGGRTRAFIIDNSNRNILYAGGVAGGIFKSTNAGLSWIPISDDLDNMAIVTLTQAANGDLYAGTGENMYTSTAGYGSRTSTGMTGGGIYKSTDGGDSWNALAATVPPSNTATNAWSAVGSIGADPSNANRIYAGTGGGLQRSDDGGVTWSNPIGQGGIVSDLSVGSDGSVWVNLTGRTYYSANGNDNTWSEISKSVAGSTDLPRVTGRQKYAISPQFPSTVYCIQTSGSALGGIYRTDDSGATWELIQAKTTLFDPLCRNGSCQGIWDLMLAVSPSDRNHIFVGGMQVWEWKRQGGWRRVDGFGPFYIHADQHEMRFDPVNPNIMYITSDGGVAKSSDGGYTWLEMNKNYNTAQFYQISIGQDRTIIGGTQDNGSHAIDGKGNTPNESTRLGFIFSANADPFAGDGGFSHISWLDEDQYFTAYQNGRMGRSENKGVSFSTFWDPRMFADVGTPGTNTWAGWMMPYHLYETTNDPLSEDSVYFRAYPSVKSEGFGNGDTTFINTLDKQQESAEFLASTFTVESGSLLVTSDAQGNLGGDGYGTFNTATGEYNVTFNKVPLAEVVIRCDVNYPSGAVISVGSNINALPFKYQLSQSLTAGDSVKIQDPVQSIVVAGLNGSVWMTRMAHNWNDPSEWWKISNVNGTAQSITMTADGKQAWVGTESGQLIRISNLDLARSLETADVEQGLNNQVTFGVVRNFGGRSVTGIAVDPNDPDRVAVTVGNYGNSDYVYYSSNATSASPTFVSKQGNLPEFPVYAVTFDKGTASNLIIGTEYGIFSTDNINAASPSWTEENSGFPRVPVFTLVQYRTDKSSDDAANPLYEGDIFAGTHGRGAFLASDLKTARPVSVEEEEDFEFADAQKQLSLFPNPAVDYTNVELNLRNSSDVSIFVRDINGRLIKQLKLNKMSAGKQEVRINTSDIASGTYLLTVQIGDQLKSGKFVVNK